MDDSQSTGVTLEIMPWIHTTGYVASNRVGPAARMWGEEIPPVVGERHLARVSLNRCSLHLSPLLLYPSCICS